MDIPTLPPHDASAPALPYPYVPPQPALQGAAFGPLFKALAWGIVLGLGVWIVRLDLPWRSSAGAWIAVSWCMLAYIVWHIQRSRIVLGPEGIEQTWMWRRRLDLCELATLQVMRVRGLEFLIAPRLYARNLGGTFTFFYCHDPVLLQEFTRLAQALREHALRP